MQFENLFRDSNGKPIEYKDETIFLADEIPVNKYFSGYLKLISTSSEWKQGVHLHINGKWAINSVKSKRGLLIWQEDMIDEIRFSGISKDGIIYIWNIWDRGYTDSLHNGAAMKKKIIGNEIIYYCNDGHPDDDFTDLIFKLVLD